MSSLNRHIRKLFSLLMPVAVVSCSVIDEDLSNCVVVEQAKLDYELRLVTNMTTELTTQLTTQTDIRLADVTAKHSRLGWPTL